MSEWLGKPRVSKEDIDEYQPSLVKSFPSLIKYYEDNQKFRLTLIFDHPLFDSFKKIVEKKYKKFTRFEADKAIMEAIEEWISKNK
ncbi:MAG: hypothetical protein HWN67_21415 [Candidatus Helarchaeota archaeon]|nr:hypothetical protein [Candidatus Helarchaeota archaeon]